MPQQVHGHDGEASDDDHEEHPLVLPPIHEHDGEVDDDDHDDYDDDDVHDDHSSEVQNHTPGSGYHENHGRVDRGTLLDDET